MNDPREAPRQGHAPTGGRSDIPTPSGTTRPSRGKTNQKLANGLVALSSAAIIAVYAAGYARTAPAAANIASGDPVAAAIVATAAPSAAGILSPTPNTSPATATTASQATANRAAAPAATATATTTATTAASTATKTTQAAQASVTLRDGTYVGTGTSRHGSIQATVVVQGGKVVSAAITDCGTRYPCSKIATLPGQVVARQSAAVDTISGATDSSVAYRAAVSAALTQAR